MGRFLMKLNSDLSDYVCKNWSKVRLDNEYGYFVQLKRKIAIFIGLDYRVYLIGLNGKIPSMKQAIKVFTYLVRNDWITPIEENNYAPFGVEFENRLPFEVDNTVIDLEGELGDGD